MNYTQKSRANKREHSPAYQPRLLKHLIDSSSDSECQIQSSDDSLQDDNLHGDHSLQSCSLQGQEHSHPQQQIHKNKNKNKQTEASFASQKTKVSQLTTYSTSNLPNNPKNRNKNGLEHHLNLKTQAEINQKNKSFVGDLSPSIKYDTLKLSSYESQKQTLKPSQIKRKERVSKCQKQQKNLNRSRFFSKIIETSQVYDREVQGISDSLDGRDSNMRLHFSSQCLAENKEMQQKDSALSLFPSSIEKKSQESSFLKLQSRQYEQEIQKMKGQIKRCKEVIRTLKLKNTDYQKQIERKNLQLREFINLENSKLAKKEQSSQFQKQIERDTIESVFQTVKQYLKISVQKFMGQLTDLKMTPLLESTIENFLEELLQFNEVTVQKALTLKQSNKVCKNVENNESSRSNHFKSPIGSKQKSIFSPLQYKENNHFVRSQILIPQNKKPQNAYFQGQNNCFRELNTLQAKLKQNNFLSNKENLTPNKKDLTPNKKERNGDELKLLEKSLQKLKKMELNLARETPEQVELKNKQLMKAHCCSNMIEHQALRTPEQQRYYSALRQGDQDAQEQIGKTQFNTVIVRRVLNLAEQKGPDLSTNKDRSKSRRKKIFADTNRN